MRREAVSLALATTLLLTIVGTHISAGSALAGSTPDHWATPRIVNGVPATKEAHPYIVSIGVARGVERPWADRHICGGTLISDRLVLTAAQCVYEYGSGVVAPTEILIGQPDQSGVLSSVRPVGMALSVRIHPNYNFRTHADDAAVIELAQPLAGVKPLIPAGRGDEVLERDGAEVITAGWGITQEGQDMLSEGLLEAKLEIVGPDQCGNSVPFLLGTHTVIGVGSSLDAESMLCAYGATSNDVADTCKGDAGGPLIAQAAAGARLVGIVSWGWGCARQYPGVYSRVTALQDWLELQSNRQRPQTNVKVRGIKPANRFVSTVNVHTTIPVYVSINFPSRTTGCTITPPQTKCYVAMRQTAKTVTVTVSARESDFASWVVAQWQGRIGRNASHQGPKGTD